MLITVTVTPDARKNEIIKESDYRFKVMVKAKPLKGMAYMAVRQILDSYFDMPETSVKLIKGFKDRNKVFSITS